MPMKITSMALRQKPTREHISKQNLLLLHVHEKADLRSHPFPGWQGRKRRKREEPDGSMTLKK
jgi:hypothetical protein